MTLFRLLAVALALSGAGFGYTRATLEGSLGGTPLRWKEAPRFLVQDTVAPDLRNADNRPVISPASRPLEALQAALDAWSSAADSSLRLGTLETTDLGLDPRDRRNVFVFDDTPAIRSLTDGAPGVSVVTTDASGSGEIVDVDIVFNPNFRIGNNQAPFSTKLELRTIDLEDTATHLLGRALGAGMTAVIGAAMFPAAETPQAFRRRLSADDEAFLAEAYPAAGAAERRGEIFGTVRESLTGLPMTGVAVTAVDVEAGVSLQTVTSLADGTYRLAVPATPTGRYLIYAESLDGPAIPAQFQTIDLSRFRTDGRTEFFGGNSAPTRLDIPPGRALRADISVTTGSSALRIERIGVDEAGGAGSPERFTAGPVAIAAGESRDLLVAGLGIDGGIGQEDIRILDGGVRIVEGSVRVDPTFRFGGGPVLRFTVESDPRPRRALVTILVLRNRVADSYTGAIAVEPSPVFTSEQIVNAASFAGGGVAPGGIYSIFGSALGPAAGLENESFDSATGRLPTELGRVRVTFDGVPAPLFFVAEGQINLQVPFEVAGKAVSAVQATYDGVAGPAVSVPVVSAQPGLFTFPDGVRAIVLNQDGTLNGPDLPAFRGEVVTLFATGQGVVEPAVASGAPAPLDPLSRAANPAVTIGGAPLAPAELFFAGLAPGFVGLLQVNARIPSGSAAGDDVEVVVEIDGQPSQPGVRMSVR